MVRPIIRQISLARRREQQFQQQKIAEQESKDKETKTSDARKDSKQ